MPASLPATPAVKGPLALITALQRPVDAGVLGAVRIGYGLVALVTVGRFVQRGWVEAFWLRPEVHLTYPALPWLSPLPGPGMYAVIALLALAALALTLGWHSRLAAGVWTAGFSWCELLEASTYLNHYYLLSVVGLLLTVVPCGAALSLDSRRRGRSAVPAWVMIALRVQVACVYGWAGVAKLQGDWLLRAEPLASWLPTRAELPVVGELLTTQGAAFVASWAGAAFDLSVVPLLLWSRSRPLAYAGVVAFHALTAVLFPIGVFPWVMIVLSLVFLPMRSPRLSAGPTARVPSLVAALVLVLLAGQVALPGRSLLAPGDANWSETGFRWSWKVLVVDKAGTMDFRVVDRVSGAELAVPASRFLTPMQEQQAATQPDLVVTSAHLLAARLRGEGIADPAVFADVFVAYNGRASQRLIDPDVDLTGVSALRASSVVVVPAGLG